jgi:hypothetical protein
MYFTTRRRKSSLCAIPIFYNVRLYIQVAIGRDVTVLDADNRVYFGGVGVAFPVMEDGTILRQCPGEVILNFPEEVRVIDRRGLGVELKWAPDLPPAPGI